MMPALALVAAYLIGAIPFGFLLVKWKTGDDIRASGSGNIGATNVLRTTGWIAGAATLILDIAKGYLAVWLAGYLTGGSELWMSAAALAVMAGHAFPVFLGGKGGKAVASFVGAYLCLTPIPLLATLVVFVVMVAATQPVPKTCFRSKDAIVESAGHHRGRKLGHGALHRARASLLRRPALGLRTGYGRAHGRHP